MARHEKIEVHHTCDFCGKVCEPTPKISLPHSDLGGEGRKGFALHLEGYRQSGPSAPLKERGIRQALPDLCQACTIQCLEKALDYLKSQ